MPRGAGGYYSAPPGTDGAPDTTIDSAKYNLFVADLEQVLNSPMPIIGGGTGGGTVDDALNNLSAEKKDQVVTNFNSFAFMSGSWRCSNTPGIPGAPIDSHAFSGIAYVIDANNMTIEARDQDGTMRPGPIYVRQKKAGVWSAWAQDATPFPEPPTGGLVYGRTNTAGVGAWARAVALAGDTMTGPLVLSADPTAALGAATKQYVDASSGAGAVRYDVVQTLTDDTLPSTAGQKTRARDNIDAAPFDALAFNGMQINGGCEVDQVNAGAAIAFAAGAVSKPVLDGMYCIKSAGVTGAFNLQQVASVFLGYSKEIKLTVTTAQPSMGSDVVCLEWLIEGYRFARMGWGTANAQPLTIGFWCKSSVGGSLVIQMINSNESSSGTLISSSVNGVVNVGGFPVLAANTAQWITATFSGPTSGTWQNTTSTGLRARLDPAIGSGINILATNGNTFEVTGVVVLPGLELPAASRAPLLMRPYEQELFLSKRYYQRAWVACDFQPSIASEVFSAGFNLVPEMRATPTVSNQAGAGSSNVSTANPISSSGYGATQQITSTATVSRTWWLGTVLCDARLA